MSAVRRAGVGDAEALTALRAIMLDRMAEGPPAAGDDVWRAATVAWFAERLRDAEVCAAFVVDEPAVGVVAGAAAVVSSSGAPIPGLGPVLSGDVVNVATRPEARGRGHARACVTALLAWMDELGVVRIGLSATPEGEPLYRSLGFEARPWVPMWRR